TLPTPCARYHSAFVSTLARAASSSTTRAPVATRATSSGVRDAPSRRTGSGIVHPQQRAGRGGDRLHQRPVREQPVERGDLVGRRPEPGAADGRLDQREGGAGAASEIARALFLLPPPQPA